MIWTPREPELADPLLAWCKTAPALACAADRRFERRGVSGAVRGFASHGTACPGAMDGSPLSHPSRETQSQAAIPWRRAADRHRPLPLPGTADSRKRPHPWRGSRAEPVGRPKRAARASVLLPQSEDESGPPWTAPSGWRAAGGRTRQDSRATACLGVLLSARPLACMIENGMGARVRCLMSAVVCRVTLYHHFVKRPQGRMVRQGGGATATALRKAITSSPLAGGAFAFMKDGTAKA